MSHNPPTRSLHVQPLFLPPTGPQTNWGTRPRRETTLRYARGLRGGAWKVRVCRGVCAVSQRESPPPPSSPTGWWRVMNSLGNDSNKSKCIQNWNSIPNGPVAFIFSPSPRSFVYYMTFHFLFFFPLRGSTRVRGDGGGVEMSKATHPWCVCVFVHSRQPIWNVTTKQIFSDWHWWIGLPLAIGICG